MSALQGYLRPDGRKGIRNEIAVVYLVECAHFVAREIAGKAGHLIGFPGCFPNDYAQMMMERLCTHPNVGAVLLVSLGCESFNRAQLEQVVADSGRPVETLVIQKSGGTASLEDVGREIYQMVLDVANGTETTSETLGHREFILTYKTFEPIGPACLPTSGGA